MYFRLGLQITVLLFSLSPILATDDSLMQELIARIEYLEHQGALQADQLKRQENEIHELQTVVKTQDEWIRRHEALTQAYQQRGTDATGPNQAEPSSDDTPRQDTRVFYGESTDDAPTPAPRAAGPVAFHSLLMAPNVTHLNPDQTVVFPDVMTNVGNTFNVTSGVFTAPVAGIYLFSLTLEASPHVYVEVSITKNGKALAYAFASGYRGDEVYDQGSVTVVTEMADGDRVWPSVFNPPDTSLYGLGFSSFMGCLITTV